MAGMLQTHFDVTVIVDQPEVAMVLGCIRELDLEHGPSRRHFIRIQAPANIPDQPARVEILGSDVSRPTLPPFPDLRENGLQLFAGLRQDIFVSATVVHSPPLDDLSVLKRLEPGFQQRCRDSRHTAANVVEVGAAGQKLAQHEQRPSLSECFGRERNRTELSKALLHTDASMGSHVGGGNYTNVRCVSSGRTYTVVIGGQGPASRPRPLRSRGSGQLCSGTSPGAYGEVHTVIETPDFVSDAKNAGMSQEEVEAVVLHVGKKPQAGDRIVGTGGARKIRFAGRSQGKSGGYRVISYFGGDDVPVFFF